MPDERTRVTVRCPDGFIRGLCVVPTCPHWDGKRYNNEATYSGAKHGPRRAVRNRKRTEARRAAR